MGTPELGLCPWIRPGSYPSSSVSCMTLAVSLSLPELRSPHSPGGHRKWRPFLGLWACPRGSVLGPR